eukprot:378432-Rhodomonas_salina.1
MKFAETPTDAAAAKKASGVIALPTLPITPWQTSIGCPSSCGSTCLHTPAPRREERQVVGS